MAEAGCRFHLDVFSIAERWDRAAVWKCSNAGWRGTKRCDYRNAHPRRAYLTRRANERIHHERRLSNEQAAILHDNLDHCHHCQRIQETLQFLQISSCDCQCGLCALLCCCSFPMFIWSDVCHCFLIQWDCCTNCFVEHRETFIVKWIKYKESSPDCFQLSPYLGSAEWAAV